MEDIVDIHVRLLKEGSLEPLKGEEYTVKFYDKDPGKDDYLGESAVDDFGHAIISVTESNFRSSEKFGEKYPDLYFRVLKDGDEIFKSPVRNNVHLEEAGDYPTSGGLHFSLGTFTI